MAVKESYMVKSVEGNTDLVLEADTGESFLVKDIMVYNPSTNYATVTLEKTTVGYFRVGGTQGNHLPFAPADEENVTLLKHLIDEDVFRGIPVAEGQKLTLTGAAQSGARQVVVYQINDAGDYTPDMPNGSEATDYDALLYGYVSGGAGDGTVAYDTSQNPAEYPDFPYEGDVPAGTTISVYGLAIADVGQTEAGQANQQGTEYLKGIKARETFWDEDKEGIPLEGLVSTTSDVTNVGEGQSLIGAYSSADRRLPLILPEPLEFSSGEEFTLSINTKVDSGSATFDAHDCELALISRIVRG